MKGTIGAIADLVGGSHRGNAELRPLNLLGFAVVLVTFIGVSSAIFHLLMVREGQEHDWFTGIYWTLTTMSTLGFGDIVFQSDLGRIFSMVVLVAGVSMLLIYLPVAFVRFYAPWVEAQFKTRVRTRVPAELDGHVIISTWDDVAEELIERLALSGIESVVIESDPLRAASLHADKVPVVRGSLGVRATYENCAFGRASLLLANAADEVNTNIVLTAREVSERVPIVATAVNPEGEAVLELAGANQVVLTARRLGKQLASRVSVGSARALTIGRYRQIAIAEFPIRNTRLAGMTLEDAQVRAETGVTVAALAKRGHLEPGLPDTMLREDCIGLAVGSVAEVEALNEYLSEGITCGGRVLVIGGGRVGREVARALAGRGAEVRIVERDPTLRESIEEVTSDIVIGDAADSRVMTRLGISEAASVVLTTNDDAANIFLAVYCRKLNPDTIIVSRVSHPSNVEAIHRAGADFAVSDSQIKIQSVVGALRGREPMIFGEGLDVFNAEVPRSLDGKQLRESGILARTGLAVIAVESNGVVNPHPRPGRVIRRGEHVLFVGTNSQRDEFERVFK